MGIFGALTNAVTGLRAQSYSLENISGNIANSQTTAFKRVDTSFQDLIPDSPTNKQLSGSVVATSRSTNTVQGDIQNASIGTFMAVNGDAILLFRSLQISSITARFSMVSISIHGAAISAPTRTASSSTAPATT